MGLLSGLGFQGAGGEGGLLSIFQDPMKMAYMAMIAKGLSPHSSIDPQQMMAQAQRMQLLREERALEEKRRREDLEHRDRQFGLAERKFQEDALTDAARAARDMGLNTGDPEYTDFITKWYQNKNRVRHGLQPIPMVGPEGEQAYGQPNDMGGVTPMQPPTGYRFSDKAPVKIPDEGGTTLVYPTGQEKRFDKRIEEGINRKSAAEQKIQQEASRPGREQAASDVSNAVSKAIDLIDRQPTWSTGVVGQASKGIGGTPANELAGYLDTIEANASFGALQKMREASPTGGALGQVAIYEIQLLKSTIAAARQSNNPRALKDALRRIDRTFNDIVHGPGSATNIDGYTIREKK